MAWLDKQWNQPDRTDNYLMQIAAEVRRGNLKNPSKLEVKDMRLKFESPQPKAKRDAAQVAARAKSKWFGFLKIKRSNDGQ